MAQLQSHAAGQGLAFEFGGRTRGLAQRDAGRVGDRRQTVLAGEPRRPQRRVGVERERADLGGGDRVAAIVADAPTPLRAIVPSAPEALEKAVLRCLAKDPASRMPDVAR